MMSSVRITPWEIIYDGPVTDYTESIFSLGNGNLGVRGFDLHTAKEMPWQHGIFKAGFFEPVRPGITDMVQLPDMLALRMEGFHSAEMTQRLELRRGVFSQTWQQDGVVVSTERMVSMADPQLICVRMTIEAERETHLHVQTAMDAWIANLPVHDDQMTAETEAVPLLETESRTATELTMRTIHSGRKIRFQQEILIDGLPVEKETISISCEPGRIHTLEKRIYCWLEGEAEGTGDFTDPWLAHEAAWERRWQDCDIQLDAEEEIQGAMRWNVFQMLCSSAEGDDRISIGARGLTHGRYKGNTFWDTDIFLLPFFCWQRPEAARNLIQYRLRHLPEAKALAKQQNLAGARYPWMCAWDGTEQCESWDIGLCEVHITGDVACAAERYCEIAGEAPDNRTREMWAETARYWRSRFTWEEKRKQFSCFFVKGPDEYCGATINNTYTNFLARHNVELALRYAGGKLSEPERSDLSFFAEHIAIPRDAESGTLLQDEITERLEPLPERKTSGEPMYRTTCFDRMQRYQALKQADLVQLMVLFPECFAKEEKQNIWDRDEPRTVHDSSLSYGVHAHLAFQLGQSAQGWDYFCRSLFLDLRDEMGNTGREGVHMAALGATWQALVYGMIGLWSQEGRIVTRVQLPPEIRAVSMAVWHHGKRYRLRASPEGATMREEE